MGPPRLLYLLFLLGANVLHAQSYKLFGRITNSKLEPLALVSIVVKGTLQGTTTNTEGIYELNLEEGSYDLVITMVGYRAQVLTVVVNKNTEQNIILEEANINNLDEVVVTGKAKDKAAEIIMNVIRNKDRIAAASGFYSCDLYIKAVQTDSTIKSSQKIIPSITSNNNNDIYKGMAMAEVYLRLDYASERQMKELRTGVQKRGKPEGLYFLSATEGNFNFYNNLVKVPSLSETSFLSPVSYSGLLGYKFKTLKIKQAGNHKIYVISVKPGKLSNAAVEGEITISDSAWVILKTDFKFSKYRLAMYDYFEVEQQYTLINNIAWMLTRQQFTYKAKANRHSLSGTTIANYSNYELNKLFDKHYFGDEVSATSAAAYKTDSNFWKTARKEALNAKELGFIRYSDSVYRATHNKLYLDSIDNEANRITWKSIGLRGQTFYRREKERTWRLPPAVSMFQPIAFGGPRINGTLGYNKVFENRKNLAVYTNLSYGIRNRDVNGSLRLTRMYNPFNRGFYSITVGRDFQFIYAADAWINLLKRSNLYLNNGISVGHGLELANGLFFFSDIDLAFRQSLKNYKTGNTIDRLDSSLGNVLDNNTVVAFDSYNAVYGKIRLQYTPAQKYIREPLEKIIIGSVWPTFYTMWRKGIPGIMNSNVNFDYLEFGIEQQINLGLAGISRYSIKTGSFLNKKQLQNVDYQFQRRGDPIFFSNPNENFQELDSTFPVFKQFYQGHFVHEFNGFLLSRIPLLRKLQLREVAGAGFLIAPERNLRYAETSAGIERVFKWPFNALSKFKVGVYVIGAVANQNTNPVRFKIGITSWDKVKGKWF